MSHWGEAGDVFHRLQGRWIMHRIIAGQARLEGAATFEPQGPTTTLYRESGRLVLENGMEADASQAYLFNAAPDGFSVRFPATGGLFHRIVLTRNGDTLTGSAQHLCGADRYDSFYRFGPEGGFTIRHRVEGPRKDYVSSTHYSADI